MEVTSQPFLQDFRWTTGSQNEARIHGDLWKVASSS